MTPPCGGYVWRFYGASMAVTRPPYDLEHDSVLADDAKLVAQLPPERLEKRGGRAPTHPQPPPRPRAPPPSPAEQHAIARVERACDRLSLRATGPAVRGGVREPAAAARSGRDAATRAPPQTPPCDSSLATGARIEIHPDATPHARHHRRLPPIAVTGARVEIHPDVTPHPPRPPPPCSCRREGRSAAHLLSRTPPNTPFFCLARVRHARTGRAHVLRNATCHRTFHPSRDVLRLRFTLRTYSAQRKSVPRNAGATTPKYATQIEQRAGATTLRRRRDFGLVWFGLVWFPPRRARGCRRDERIDRRGSSSSLVLVAERRDPERRFRRRIATGRLANLATPSTSSVAAVAAELAAVVATARQQSEPAQLVPATCLS